MFLSLSVGIVIYQKQTKTQKKNIVDVWLFRLTTNEPIAASRGQRLKQ